MLPVVLNWQASAAESPADHVADDSCLANGATAELLANVGQDVIRFLARLIQATHDVEFVRLGL